MSDSDKQDGHFATTKEDIAMDEELSADEESAIDEADTSSSEDLFRSFENTPSPSPSMPPTTQHTILSPTSSTISSTTSFHSLRQSPSGMTSIMSHVNLRPTPTPSTDAIDHQESVGAGTRSVTRLLEVDESAALRAKKNRLSVTVEHLNTQLLASQEAQLAAQSNAIELQKELSCLREGFDYEVARHCAEREARLHQAVREAVESQDNEQRTKLEAVTQAHEKKCSEAERQLEDQRAQLETIGRELEMRKFEVEEVIHRHEATREAQNAEYYERMKELQQEHCEVQKARNDAETAHGEAETARREAETARSEVETARGEVETARSEVETARGEVETARSEVETARGEVETARSEVETARLCRMETLELSAHPMTSVPLDSAVPPPDHVFLLKVSFVPQKIKPLTHACNITRILQRLQQSPAERTTPLIANSMVLKATGHTSSTLLKHRGDSRGPTVPSEDQAVSADLDDAPYRIQSEDEVNVRRSTADTHMDPGGSTGHLGSAGHLLMKDSITRPGAYVGSGQDRRRTKPPASGRSLRFQSRRSRDEDEEMEVSNILQHYHEESENSTDMDESMADNEYTDDDYAMDYEDRVSPPRPTEKIHAQGHSTGGQGRKRKNLPERKDAIMPTAKRRKEYLAILREVLRTKYDIPSDMAWYEKIPATKAEVNAFESEQGPGPGSDVRPYMGSGWRMCRWNNAIFNTVLQDFLFECQMRGRRMQGREGEKPEETHQRNIQEYDWAIHNARISGNRRNKYKRRKNITTRCVENKIREPLKGTLLRAVSAYLEIGGQECMSSEDDCVDSFGRKVRHKKRLPWRPEEVNFAMIVTDSMRNHPGLYASCGSKPALSMPGFNATTRDAPRGLPISFYNRQWYDSLSVYKKERLGATMDDCE
ncbi:hypothetical protein OBBRIDRAFT_839552 [Obba rivulosa]|uniref:Uncharacterized protein n=1 Tax=Obba rivulosa TaxID=1052685 RepID=A0A8E2AJR3_9APHY|nr:hypothetical protein OBBRIDRAFT_839552 [Obba rivulosa]